MAIFSMVFGLAGFLNLVVPVAHAATSPDLGTAAAYSVLAGSEVTNTGVTTISGDVGISPGIGAAPHFSGFGTVVHGGAMHDADGAALIAQDDKNLAFTALASQDCDTDYGAITKELAGETLVPGVYCANSFHVTNGTLTLNGNSSGVWIFKSASDLIITGSSAEVVFTGGGLSCNTWWRVVSTATLAAGSTFVGNILADTSITLAAGASLDGRALARTAEVTLDNNVISGPTCTAPPTPGGGSSQNIFTGSITVVKTIINDNGRTAITSDFPLFINGVAVTSGTTNYYSFLNNFTPYTVSEISNAQYTQSFSGDCDANGLVYLDPAENAFCVITNNDIGAPVVVPPVPPLIDVVKVPSPLALPNGPGLVQYTYTTRNIGTVPMTDVTMVGDTCSPLVLISGDTDDDNQLDVTETWVYTCSTTLSETHTNTVTATGWANGLSAVDVASATVVVGVPVVPPVIHVTKLPSPLTLLAGGGMVTYTATITNPGAVAINNVRLTDDTCSPMTYISGDTNNDSMLDTTESWIYTCRTNVTSTMVNTVIASGDANGLTARDVAIAPVVVASALAVVPGLPKTGFAPTESGLVWSVVVASIAFAGSLFRYIVRRRDAQ
ncbi:MAG: ice-binding family protein [bacterium]|nr:ice-binding family protein [bacterium]